MRVTLKIHQVLSSQAAHVSHSEVSCLCKHAEMKTCRSFRAEHSLKRIMTEQTKMEHTDNATETPPADSTTEIPRKIFGRSGAKFCVNLTIRVIQLV